MSSDSSIPRSLRAGPSSSQSDNDHLDDPEPTASGEVEHNESQALIHVMERTNLSYPRGDVITKSKSRTHRHQGALKAKSDAYVDYTNKTIGLEQLDSMFEQFERKADSRIRRTYANGHPLEEVIEAAPTLTVGLTFLPGADKPQVNRSEQINMEGKEPDQKDAFWRVTTAASLLSQFQVMHDLSIVKTDQTKNIVARAYNQSHGRDNQAPVQRRALTRRGRHPDEVTIDSDHVTIVKNLHTSANWDLRGLLVEVDWSSLWDLMVNYRNLINGGGPDMTFDETRTLLETMIEDARRLCIRSPILFRMSTRVQIMNSENTRYGIDYGKSFRTLTTSKGIKEIISLSASYYNSLDPNGSNDLTQKHIRPKFLQMVVLLLSLLNNEDLSETKDFLEATYKLKADRRDIELLIVKVIPLLSINPRVFLDALVPAFEGFPLDKTSSSEDHKWNVFVTRILDHGYILPGTVNDLGRDKLSWISKWPEDGIKSTSVFNNLQFEGPLKTINDIPPVEVNPGSDATELTVVMSDDSKYVINPQDIDSIIFMTPGIYPMQKAAQGKRSYDLSINETPLNGELYQAIKMTNEIVSKVNQWIANPKRNGNMMNRIVRRKSDYQSFLSDFRGTGKLVEVVARLNRMTLAVTYKIDGHKISRIDAEQTMARDMNRLQAFVDYIEQKGDAADYGFFSGEKRELRQSLEQVKSRIRAASESRAKIGMEQELSNEPVAKILYPEGIDAGNGDIWYGYRAWYDPNDEYLHVEAVQSRISDVNWLNNALLELSFHGQLPKLVVTPLQAVPEGYRHDEVHVDDIVVLIGRYIALGDERETSAGRQFDTFSMVNCLKIVSKEEQNQSRRGRNRTQYAHTRTMCHFR